LDEEEKALSTPILNKHPHELKRQKINHVIFPNGKQATTTVYFLDTTNPYPTR